MKNAIITRLTSAMGCYYDRQDITADLLEKDLTVDQAIEWLANEYEREDGRAGLRRAEGFSGWGIVFEVVEDEEYLAVTEKEA